MTEPRTLTHLSAARLQGGVISGYCVYVDTPATRALIDISFRGTYLKTAPAAFASEEAGVLGVGDGRHGFSVPLASLGLSGEEAGDIVVRERRYKEAIGRIRLGAGVQAQHLRDKALQIERRIEALSSRLSPADERLPAGSDFSPDKTDERPWPKPGGAGEGTPRLGRMPVPPTPKASLVLYSSGAFSTVADTVLSLIDFCRTHDLELLVASGGDEDVALQLPSRIEGVLACGSRLDLHSDGAIPYDAINQAVSAARSQRIFVASMHRDSLEVLEQLVKRGDFGDLVGKRGPASEGSMSRLGEDRRDYAAVGFKKSLFTTIGGFEPAEGPKSSLELFLSKAATFGVAIEDLAFTAGTQHRAPS